MKAAILAESNAPLVVADIELPPLGVGQVLVKVHKSGICGAQLNEIAAIKGVDKFLPHLLGHEGGGEVLEIGPGVTQVKPGDHVVMHWRKGAGIHSQTPKYKWNGKIVNGGWVTTFNELSIASENRLTPIPQGTDLEVAALMGCAVTTALGIIENLAKMRFGESIAVFGCGGVGLHVIQGAALVSASPIIAIDLYDNKLNLAREFGATHCINSSRQDIADEIKKIAGSKGVDVAVENTGNVKVIETAYNITASQGRTILVGVPRHDEDITIHSLPLHFGRVLTGCEGGNCYPTTDIPRYLKLYEAGKLRLDRVITHRFPLEDINTALDKIRSGEVGRCMIAM